LRRLLLALTVITALRLLFPTVSLADIYIRVRKNSRIGRTLLLRLMAGTLLLAGVWIAYTHNLSRKPGLNRIAGSLYEIEGAGGNVAVYITSEGVILVDDMFEYDYNGIVDTVKSVTSQPIRYVFNTHHHSDHTGGNARFLPNAEIFAHSNARKHMLEGRQPGTPRVTFTEEASVFLGGKQVRARYFGRGHTDGDVMIYFPELKVLHVGDLMTDSSPVIDYAAGGSLVEWTTTLDEALKMDFDTVIPGHGPVAKRADLIAYRNKVEKLKNRVFGLLRCGAPRGEVARVLVREYGWEPGGKQMALGFEGMLAELSRRPESKYGAGLRQLNHGVIAQR
jgi:cyclase